MDRQLNGEVSQSQLTGTVGGELGGKQESKEMWKWGEVKVKKSDERKEGGSAFAARSWRSREGC